MADENTNATQVSLNTSIVESETLASISNMVASANMPDIPQAFKNYIYAEMTEAAKMGKWEIYFPLNSWRYRYEDENMIPAGQANKLVIGDFWRLLYDVDPYANTVNKNAWKKRIISFLLRPEGGQYNAEITDVPFYNNGQTGLTGTQEALKVSWINKQSATTGLKTTIPNATIVFRAGSVVVQGSLILGFTSLDISAAAFDIIGNASSQSNGFRPNNNTISYDMRGDNIATGLIQVGGKFAAGLLNDYASGDLHADSTHPNPVIENKKYYALKNVTQQAVSGGSATIKFSDSAVAGQKVTFNGQILDRNGDDHGIKITASADTTIDIDKDILQGLNPVLGADGNVTSASNLSGSFTWYDKLVRIKNVTVEMTAAFTGV